MLATITGNDAGRYFGVKGLDGDHDSLVNTTDPYNGTTLLDGNVGGTTQLQVTATGPWSITLSDPRSAPSFGKGTPYAGSGDAVLIYQGMEASARSRAIREADTSVSRPTGLMDPAGVWSIRPIRTRDRFPGPLDRPS